MKIGRSPDGLLGLAMLLWTASVAFAQSQPAVRRAGPEYQKYLDDYPGRAGRANAYFSLGECYRNLNRASNARTNFQKVLNDYGESEFAGPAAYALAEMAFTQKDYATALPLFHRSATKSKDAA